MLKLIFAFAALLFSKVIIAAVVCVSSNTQYAGSSGYCAVGLSVEEARRAALKGGFFASITPETATIRISCEQDGWYSFMAMGKISNGVGLTCGQATKTAALKAAFQSCKSKGDCSRPYSIFVGKASRGQMEQGSGRLCLRNNPDDPFNPDGYETRDESRDKWRGKGDMPECTEIIRLMQ